MENTDRIKSMLDDPAEFAKYYLPHLFRREIDARQRELADAVQPAVGGPDPKTREINLSWPRGTGASVWIQVAIPLWLAARGDFRGMYSVSRTMHDAWINLGGIRNEMLHNERLISDFGDKCQIGEIGDIEFYSAAGAHFIPIGRGQAMPRRLRSSLIVMENLVNGSDSLRDVWRMRRWINGELKNTLSRGNSLFIKGPGCFNYEI